MPEIPSTASRTLRWLILCLLALLLCGCGGGGGGAGSSSSAVRISISPASPIVAPGGTVAFQATVTGSSNQQVTWSASLGSITSDGDYTAPTATGTYTVVATSVADPSVTALASVSVQTINSVFVSVTPPTATVGYRGQVQFAATVSGTADQTVTWTASSGTISQQGLFTAPNYGTRVTVQAHSAANSASSASAEITVTNTGAIVQITPLSAKIPVLGTYQFTAKVLNVPNQAVTWTATGGTINGQGLFTAGDGLGNFSVTATSVANPSQSATVPIEITPVAITISVSNTQVVVGQSIQFSATVYGISNQSVTWSASAGTISATGLFTAPATPQSVTITATSTQNSGYTASETETVVNETDDFYSFDSGVPSVWSPTTWSTTPSGTPFLGLLGGSSQTATLSLGSLTAHTSLTVNFQVFVVGAWTGISGAAPFVVSVDGTQAFSQTFSNVAGDNQSFPSSSNSPPGTGAAATNSLGYTSSPAILYNDATYAISLTNVPHTANTVTIVFSSSLSGTLSQMSWGLKNVEVIANP